MKLWKRWRHMRRRGEFEADLAEEVRFHREMAGARFGSEALALEDSRAVWGFAWWDSFSQDLRYALRGFRRTPGFALTVAGTIGLGLGLNTTLFTVFNAYVLRPMAVADPYSLYGFTWTNAKGAGHDFTIAEYERLRASGTPFSNVLAYDSVFAALDGRTILGQAVSGNYFQMLGVGTVLGRPLAVDDRDAVVLGHATWKDQFGGDASILGKKLFLRGQPVVVVGVASPGFGGLQDFPAGFWVPLAMTDRLETRRAGKVEIIGRLKPAVRLETARAGLAVWARQQTAGLPDNQKAAGVLLESHATMVPFTWEAMFVAVPVLVAFGLVLLTACANVSNMMLARALARQREIGIRISLGAGRARLIRQLLTESLLLAIAAAGLAFVVSSLTTEAAWRIFYATMPSEFVKILHFVDLKPDARVFGFLLAASLGAALLFGLAPAIQTTRSRLVEANRGDFSSDYRPTRLRNALVVTQVTVCTLLLICSGIVLNGALRVGSQNFGVELSNVFDVQVGEKFQAQAAAVLAREGGVEGVAATWHAPLYGQLRRVPLMPAGSREMKTAGYNYVSPEYFSLLRIPLLEGRGFSAEEGRSEAAVAVLSESAARRLFPHADAVGQSLAIHGASTGDPYYSRMPSHRTAVVIGVARDVVNWTSIGRDTECLYLPTSPAAAHNGSLLVRVNGRKTLVDALDRVAPSLADFINPMDQVLAVQVYPFRASFWVSAFLGGLALMLTVSGIFGVLSYLVSQRTREIGIRVALGAQSGSIVGMVMRQSMRLAGIGIALGVVLAMAAVPVFAREVPQLKSFDGGAYAGGALLVMVAAAVAAWDPARRAVKVDPVASLRCD